MDRALVTVLCAVALMGAQRIHAQATPMASIDRLFLKLDADRDGVIERDEARKSPLLINYFEDADTNADDAIDRMEFAVFETAGGGVGGGLGYGTATPGGTTPVTPPDTTAPPAAGATPPAGTPPPTSSGTSDGAAPGLPAGTPPPPSSAGTPGTTGAPTPPAGTPPPTSSGGTTTPGSVPIMPR